MAASLAQTCLSGLRTQLNDCKAFIASRRAGGTSEVELLRAIKYESALIEDIAHLEDQIATADKYVEVK